MNRVLIIEDDAVARRQLAQLFRFEEFAVVEAESGDAGIAAARSAPPDLVICDIMMPGTDGFGVLEALRSGRETVLTPFIFLTAKAGGKDVREGMNQGADDYITKPFDQDALLASARQRLARRRAQIQEAEQRATATGMLAAAALPREIEASLAHLDTLSETIAVTFDGDERASRIRRSLREELKRLRHLSQRLKLYGELPSLYAQRFSSPVRQESDCSRERLEEFARGSAERCSRGSDLIASLAQGAVPIPEDLAAVVVDELVNNACKFSAPATPVFMETTISEAYWKLVVVDKGQGMSADQVRQVGAFKQFWNGSERPCGLGVGLVLVQAVVRLLGGETQIESEPGAGTTVTIMGALE